MPPDQIRHQDSHDRIGLQAVQVRARTQPGAGVEKGKSAKLAYKVSLVVKNLTSH